MKRTQSNIEPLVVEQTQLTIKALDKTDMECKASCDETDTDQHM